MESIIIMEAQPIPKDLFKSMARSIMDKMNEQLEIYTSKELEKITFLDNRILSVSQKIINLISKWKDLYNSKQLVTNMSRDGSMLGEEFKSVFESFKCSKCEETNKKYNELTEYNNTLFKKHKRMMNDFTDIKAQIKPNNERIEGIWKWLKKTREAVSMVYEQNKAMKETIAKQKLDIKIIKIEFNCIEYQANKQKSLVLAEHVKKSESCILEFSDQPITDRELIEFSNSLKSSNIRNTIKEIRIINAYTHKMEGLMSLMGQNSNTLKKITINNTLIGIDVVVNILKTLETKVMALDELNVDENQIESKELGLLIEPLSKVRVRFISLRRNELRATDIEKFCKVTANMVNVERISVGVVEIPEQKELEWRTQFRKLFFERKLLNIGEYVYIN